MKNYYKVLGVSSNATSKQIKSAFRKKALKYHPDKNPNSNTRNEFIEIYTAFDVLSDSDKRKAYDNKLDNFESETIAENNYKSKKKANEYASMSYEGFKNSFFYSGLTTSLNTINKSFFYFKRFSLVSFSLLPTIFLIGINLFFILNLQIVPSGIPLYLALNLVGVIFAIVFIDDVGSIYLQESNDQIHFWDEAYWQYKRPIFEGKIIKSILTATFQIFVFCFTMGMLGVLIFIFVPQLA